jgi:xanthine dehydrogenase YagT iron-sulfur-binding subunit
MDLHGRNLLKEIDLTAAEFGYLAFIDQDAFQCGYCTPGQILSAIGCIDEGHAGSDAEIREHMSGNLCRCAAYPHIVKAIDQAKGEMRS